MSAERARAFICLLAVGIVGLSGCANMQTNSVARTDGAVLASAPVDHGPTFYADALPILQQNCVACHQPDGPKVGGLTAPMSLIAYEDARPWAGRIKRALETGYMPPWGAHVQHQGTFKDERYITDADKATLIAWVDAGAQAGDPADALAWEARVAAGEVQVGGTSLPPSGWWIGDPDLVVAFSEPVHVADDVLDWQPTFHMPVAEGQHDEARWVSKAELRPGGPWVHHIVSSHMGVGVPGRGPFTYPEGLVR